MSQNLKINRGVELMLRRDKKELETNQKGFSINQSITLLRKKFHFKMELTWEG